MANTVTNETKERLRKSYPYGDKWTFRIVKSVMMKDAFYKVGDIIKVKYFATFGCYDHKDRWVDYWDLGQEVLQPKNWKD